jgi:putative MATE family efflux protein
MKKTDITRDKIDFGSGKIGPLFRSMFFPTLVGMLFMATQTIIDGVLVGRGVGAEGIAAVNIVAPIWTVVTGIGLMFGIGASVVASMHLAENNEKAARIILTQAFGVGFILVSIVVLFCLLMPKTVVYALGCSAALEHYALDYLLWLLPGMLLLLWQCVGMMMVRLDGSPRYAMWIQVAGAVVNLTLDWLFIFPMGMEVKGAAIATAIACIVGGLMSLSYFIWFSDKLKFYRLKASTTSLLLTLRNTGYMMKLGSATFLTEIAMSITMVAGNYMFMSMLHEDGVAAFAIVCYLFPVIFSVNNAVAQSAQPIISYNYGAGDAGRVGRALRVSLYAATLCGLCVLALLIFGDRFAVGAFLRPSEPAYALATDGLPWFAICSPFFALNVAFVGYYQSTTQAKRAMVYTMLRGIVFAVLGFMLLPRFIGAVGLWTAIPMAEALTLLIIVGEQLVLKAKG